jgi:hypothetical protein
MKKFTKVCLITSLLFIIIGGTLCAVGAAAGGWRLARELGTNNSLVWFAWEIPGHYGWRHWYDWDDLEDLEDIKEANDLKIHSGSGHETAAGNEIHHDETAGTDAGTSAGNASQDYENTGVRAADVKNLQIEIGGAAVYLYESEDDFFRIKTEGKGTYRSYEKGGTFYLEGNLDHKWVKNGISNEEKVYLCLPKGIVFHEADIEIGAGWMEIDILSADEISLSAGAGGIAANKLACTELEVDTGAGEVTLYDVTAQKMDVENGLGSTYVKGMVSYKIDIECGMGNTELELTGSETDYNYDIECAMGSIDIGDKSYGALAENIYTNNKAPGECSIECSMGTVSISFSNP